MIGHLLSEQPVAVAADWKAWNVSLCIVAMCESTKKFICVSDNRVSFRDFSSDTLAMKNEPFIGPWIVQFAGNDMQYVPPILADARSTIRGHMKRRKRKPTPQEIGDELQRAWWRQLDKIIECQVLRRHNFTLKSFLDDGKKKCTASVYNNLRSRIEQVKMSLQFLVAGFDEKGEGHLLVIDGITPPASYDSVGIWAIGSGANAALSSLAFDADKAGLSKFSKWPLALYCTLAARFMAASATDVSRESTFVTIHAPHYETHHMTDAGIATVKKIWEDSGAPSIPKRAIEQIPNLVYNIDPDADKTIEDFEKRVDAIVGKPGYLKKRRVPDPPETEG